MSNNIPQSLMDYSKNFVFSSEETSMALEVWGATKLKDLKIKYPKNRYIYEYVAISRIFKGESNKNSGELKRYGNISKIDSETRKDIKLLYISFNSPAEIKILKEFVNLEVLVLRFIGNDCFSINFLSDNSEIMYLNLSNIRSIENYSCILKLKKLKVLNLSNNGSLVGLKLDFSSLTSLDLSSNCLNDSDLISIINHDKPDRRHQKLEGLNLANNNLCNISILYIFNKLKKLNVGNNIIEDISVVGKLIYLKQLNLDKNRISSGYCSLENLEHLKVFNISNNTNIKENILNHITSKKIEKLNLINNRISKINIDSYILIESLNLSKNLIREIDLVKLKKLQNIDISDNRLEGLELKSDSLENVRASNNNLKEISICGDLRYTKEIDLRNNNLQTIELPESLSINEIQLNISHNVISSLPYDIVKKYIGNFKSDLFYQEKEVKDKPLINIANNPLNDPSYEVIHDNEKFNEWSKDKGKI